MPVRLVGRRSGLPISLLNDRFGLDLLNLRLDDEAKKQLGRWIAHTELLRGDPERKWGVPVSSREAARARLLDPVTWPPSFSGRGASLPNARRRGADP